MRFKLLVLTGYMAQIIAMEPQDNPDVRIQMDEADGSPGVPRVIGKRLVRVKKYKKIPRSKSAPLIAGSQSDGTYVTDACDFILHVPSFGSEYPEDELAKAFKYHAVTYPTDYARFMGRVRNLKDASHIAGSCEEKDLIIQVLRFMYEFRYVNAHEHLADKEEVVVAHDQLVGAHQQLEAQSALQQQQTKHANYRAIGVAAGGMIVTIVTGLTTYFARPTLCPVCPVNTTARMLMLALNTSGI